MRVGRGVPASLLIAQLTVMSLVTLAYIGVPSQTARATTAIAPSLRGFDTCNARNSDGNGPPTVSDMQTWWTNSPFFYIGIYLPGAQTIAVACPSYGVRLSATWVTKVHNQGWAFLPIWDGLQDPCSGSSHTFSKDGLTANNQGHTAASDAESKMKNLGFGKGAVIYDDLEPYDTTISTCVNAAHQFIKGWDQQLSSDGWASGAYGSAVGSDMDGLWNLTFNPHEGWLAAWDGNNTVWNIANFPNADWVQDQRLHQWKGGHDATFGGITINIDSDCSVGVYDMSHVASEDPDYPPANETDGPSEDPPCN
jgi:Domain of unknown function (DUF1906)